MPRIKILVLLLAFSVAGVALAQTKPSTRKRRTAPTSTTTKKPLKRPGRITGGYVLTHEHPTYGMAFGGNYAFAGKAGNYKNGVMEKGYTAECGGCRPGMNCDHGEFKGNITAAIGAMGRDMGDHGRYMGPSANSFSHLRYSTEWIKEAFNPTETRYQDTRLKVMVAFAVEAEGMCEQLYSANKGNGGPGGNGYACTHGDSLQSLERQIANLKKWAAGNRSWMEIAYSASDARRIANAGKLVVILGIESEYSFGAEDSTFDPVARLNRYYSKGVRTFYLAHKINSRLAGADIYKAKNSSPGKAVRALQAIQGCFHYDDHVGPFPLVGGNGHRYCDNNCGDGHLKGGKPFDKCVSSFGEISELNMTDYVLGRGNAAFNGFNIYPQTPGFSGQGGSHMEGQVERNNLGLSHDGERIVRAAMMKGMIVNIDHVSTNARNDIYRISHNSFGDYPLNALHNNPNEMLAGKFKPHEYDFDKAERDKVRTTGGFFGVRVGPIHSKRYDASGIQTECPKTSTETGKILAKLLDEGLSVGYSLDYATITEGVHSRTYETCGANLGVDEIHRYGTHVAEGLSHVGMMKKWHRELETVGLRDTYLQKLRNDGAEQFIAMWERSERKSRVGSQIPRQTFQYAGGSGQCGSNSDCGNDEYCADPIAGQRSCKALKVHGQTCTASKQCTTNRCAWGRCADADECNSNSDCTDNRYCGNPVSGKRTCKARKPRGQACTSANQCTTNRCAWGRCADADECNSNSDCTGNRYCGNPVSGKRTCKSLKAHGQTCTSSNQCSTNRCAWGRCADADECRSSTDCSSSQYCGNPVSGKRKCKSLKPRGRACTTGNQCASGRCTFLTCK